MDDERIPTPAWLVDPDVPAPCPCGRPPWIGEPLALVEGEHGLKRWVHASCMSQMMEPPNEQA